MVKEDRSCAQKTVKATASKPSKGTMALCHAQRDAIITLKGGPVKQESLTMMSMIESHGTL